MGKYSQNIRHEILLNGTELRNCIEASKTPLLLEIEDFKNKVTKLEEENSVGTSRRGRTSQKIVENEKFSNFLAEQEA